MLFAKLFSTRLLLSSVSGYYYLFMTELFVLLHRGMDYCKGV
jgi:hypothetical protein